MPKTAEVRPSRVAELPKYGPYKSERSYARAVKAAGGTLPDLPVPSLPAAE